MKKHFLLWLAGLIVFASTLTAQIPAGYYDGAQGLTGAPLKTALYNIIKGHTEKSYSALWTCFYTTDDKANGKVWDMYSDIPGGTPAYEYTFGSDQCGNYGGEGDCYNREHSFPKSWFNEGTPMYSDLFHLCPTDGYVNGKRSNYPFGEVGTASWTSTNGSKLGSSSFPGYSGIVFEPRNDFKGDFARGYLYMATRYENVIANWENYDSNGDAMMDGTPFPCYEPWALSLLIKWHLQDPVSQKEIDRNNAIYGFQHNRNPFIDHPEYACAIWDQVAPSYVSGYPQVTNVTDVSATIAVQLNDKGTSYHLALESSVPAPEIPTVKQGTAVTILAANTTYTSTITSLNPSSEYKIYFVAEDNCLNPNTQAQLTSVVINTLVGISSVNQLKNATINPNPANDYFTIIHTTDIKQVVVYNTQMKQVLNFDNISSANQEFSVKGLSSGYYFVKITDSKGNTATKQLIKQ